MFRLIQINASSRLQTQILQRPRFRRRNISKNNTMRTQTTPKRTGRKPISNQNLTSSPLAISDTIPNTSEAQINDEPTIPSRTQPTEIHEKRKLEVKKKTGEEEEDVEL